MYLRKTLETEIVLGTSTATNSVTDLNDKH